MLNFWADRGRPDGRYPYCKTCGAESKRLSRERHPLTEPQRERRRSLERGRYKNRPEMRAKTMEWNERLRRRNVTLMRRIKAERGCVACGECDPVVLQFHHRDPSAKKFNVAQPGTSSEVRLLAEIEKCDVLCANCHMRLHAREKASARCA